MEETVKELKADLKNARELISCLTETVKALKPGRDEDLHRKLDEILSQRENQKELERKMDSLREEFVDSRKDIETLKEIVKKVAEEVSNFKEMKHITDSVETSVGYLELFVKDFEQIHLKIREMDAGMSFKFQEVAIELEGLNNENLSIRKEFVNFGVKLENLANDIPTLIGYHRELMDKMDNLETEFKCDMDTISRMEEKIVKNEEEKCDFQYQAVENEEENGTIPSQEFKETQTEALEEVKIEHKIELNEEVPRESKCRKCKSVLSINVPLREDGVSLECPKCGSDNILGRLKEGNKWMQAFATCFHYQQYPIYREHGVMAQCLLCGKRSYLYDANDCMV